MQREFLDVASYPYDIERKLTPKFLKYWYDNINTFYEMIKQDIYSDDMDIAVIKGEWKLLSQNEYEIATVEGYDLLVHYLALLAIKLKERIKDIDREIENVIMNKEEVE